MLQGSSGLGLVNIQCLGRRSQVDINSLFGSVASLGNNCGGRCENAARPTSTYTSCRMLQIRLPNHANKESIPNLGRLFQKKSKQQTVGGGVEYMEIPGAEHDKLQGSITIKKELKFSGVFKKKSCGISIGLGFRPWNFPEVSHNFAEFPGVKACFLRNF